MALYVQQLKWLIRDTFKYLRFIFENADSKLKYFNFLPSEKKKWKCLQANRESISFSDGVKSVSIIGFVGVPKTLRGGGVDFVIIHRLPSLDERVPFFNTVLAPALVTPAPIFYVGDDEEKIQIVDIRSTIEEEVGKAENMEVQTIQ